METKNPAQTSGLPLCVDLDGTLIFTDLTFESLLSSLKRAPWLLLLIPLWLLKGKSHLKDQLARRSTPDVSVLPYNQAVVALVREAKKAGRQTVLVTGSHEQLATPVAAYLAIFDVVLATEADNNLIGANKARQLDEMFGQGRYEYVANAQVDITIWRNAAAAITVNASKRVVQEVAAMGKPHNDLPKPGTGLRIWLRAVRIQQWLKNLLLFIPIVTAHEMLNWEALAATALAFVCFGACASATYIINDLLDLDADRHHHKKRNRPFAAGAIDLKAGLTAVVVLLSTGLGLSWVLPTNFQLALVAYLAITLLYSLRLKRVASLDVIVLAGLYTLRIIAGAFAASINLSFWLLAFSMFIFLSLAIVKRVAELVEIRKEEQAKGKVLGTLHGRDYATDDSVVLQSLGAASGYLSVLVLALYIHSPEVTELYRTPELLWLIAPLMLLWVTRLWVVTARGYMDEDPIFFAVTDPETWATGVVVAGILMAAALVPS